MKVDCMAGTAIFKKKQHSNNSNETPNLNITLHSAPASICCCLWLQQPKVVEDSNSNRCKTNDRLMKEYSNNYCLNSSRKSGGHNSALDGRILTNYNYNTEKTVKLKKHQLQPRKQLPLTLSVAFIIVTLSILLIQMPTMVQSKAIYAADQRQSLTETSAELETKLLLSLLAEAQPREHDTSSSVTAEDESSLDKLTSIEVLRHIQRTQAHQRERRMRLRKRHTRDLIITKYLHENGQNLEWKNPCNVDRVNIEEAEARHVTKQQTYQYLKKFERDVLMEYELINITANTISLSDMAQWDIHEDVYKFLPKLNANGSIALSRWYRNMQVYVASFGYLARSQYKYDMKKRRFAGDTSEELNKLLASARFILCELETTINGSAPHNNLSKLKTISRRAMNNRLYFVTKRHQANGIVVEPFLTDLKFAKSSYFQFLSNMQKTLNRKLQNQAKKYGIVDSAADYSSNTIIVGDDNNSLDFSSIFKSDSSLSLGESIEILLKTTKKPHSQRRRTQKRKNA